MNVKKLVAASLATMVLALTIMPAEAEYYGRHYRRYSGGAVAAGVAGGLLGGLLIGSAMAPRPAYAAPAYVEPAPEPVYYAQPRRAPRCFMDYVGNDGWGRPLYQRLCR